MTILMNGCYVCGNSYGCGCEYYLYICKYMFSQLRDISFMECSEIERRSIPVEEEEEEEV